MRGDCMVAQAVRSGEGRGPRGGGGRGAGSKLNEATRGGGRGSITFAELPPAPTCCLSTTTIR